MRHICTAAARLIATSSITELRGRLFRCLLWAAALLVSLVLTRTTAFGNDIPDLPNVTANNNRNPAGVLKNGQLTVRLEVSKARWYADRETDPSIVLSAFREEGKPPQIPGPLVRVQEGTQVVATVRNLLPRNVFIHGLHERPGNASDTVEIATGATREIRFRVGKAGTYSYWATTVADSTLVTRPTDDTQLSGAFVVDKPGAMPLDRIFVLGLWLPNPPTQTSNVASINGKSWPYTEPLSMAVGQTASWRVINGSGDWHAMHLHGFHFSVDSIGDGETDRPYASDARSSAVTQPIPPGGSMAMTWTPQRAGNWMFHCHMTVHMSRQSSLAAAQEMNHQQHGEFGSGMSGLVLGIKVEGNNQVPPPSVPGSRNLRLHLRERAGGWPSLGIELEEQGSPVLKKDAPLPLVGPPVILTRGQPVAIEVVNHLNEQTAIHWHGMELESYYDGVPEFGGDALRTTPAILPGESFVARMTPPDVGTFIYHTHWHDQQQLVNGLYGPLIVLAPGEKFDADHDKIFMFSFGKFLDPLGLALLLNGTPQPFQLRLRTGEKYRFRLINITANAADMEVSLSSQGALVDWKKLAKDGRDLPAALAVTAPAHEVLTVGETRDFEYRSDHPTELQLEGVLPRSKRRVVLTLVFENKG